MIGRTLGGYRVVEQIGMGGMATVYKAYDASTDRYVALKTLPQQYSKDPQFVERFRREALAIGKLEHLHILPLFTFGEDDGTYFLVMRYLPAGTLSERIRQMEHMPLEEASRLLGQIAGALDHAHNNGVLHRDVKPSNVLVDADGNAYLTDFGIARMVEGTLDLTGDSILGTPQYMSPEQCQGRKDLTPATDQYSLGVVLYEMVTGQTPFQAETPLAVIHMQLMGSALPLPSTVRADLPEAAERVMLKALAREPGERYASCGALAKAFAAAVQGQADVTARAGMVGAPTIKADPTAPLPLPPSDAPTTRLSAQKTPEPPARRFPLMWIGAAVLLAIVAVVALQAGGAPASASPTATVTAEPTSAAVVPSSTPVPTPLPTAAPTAVLNEVITKADGLVASGDFGQAIETYTQALEQDANSVELLVKRAEVHHLNGDDESALIDYALALEAEPDSLAALRGRAALYVEQGNTQAALDDLTQLLELDPDDAAAYVMRGRAHYQYGELDAANADFTQAIKLSPELVEAYVQRAMLRIDQSQSQLALDDLTEVVQLAGDDASTFAMRGRVYRDLGEYDLALGDYRKAIELDPENPQLYADRATVYEWRGDADQAVSALDEAIKLDPQFLSAYIQRAENQRYRQQFDLALVDYLAARKLDATSYFAYQGPAQLYLDAHFAGAGLTDYDLDQALADADHAIELFAEDAGIYYTRGMLYSLRGDSENAISDYSRSIEIYGDYSEVYRDRGDEYMNIGRFELAAQDYTRTIELSPETLDAYYGRIEALMQAMDDNGTIEDYDLDNALEDADQAIKLDSSNAVGFLLRGKVKGRMGNQDEALTDLNQAIEMSPELAWAYEERGFVFGAMGDFDAAKADFEKAIELEPDNSWNYVALGDLLFDNGRRREALAAYRSYIEQVGEDSAEDYVRERIAELQK